MVGRHVAFGPFSVTRYVYPAAAACVCERDTDHSFERGNFKFYFVTQGGTQMTWLDFGKNRIHNVPPRAVFLKNDPNFDSFCALVHLFVQVSQNSCSPYLIWYSGVDIKEQNKL